MQTADLNAIAMHAAWYEHDPAMRITVTFPYYAGNGNQSSAVVSFAIEPGHYLGTHTDGAEEILLLLSGTVEARLGDEVGQLSTGQTALIPAMVPHGLRNSGAETARCVGFFCRRPGDVDLRPGVAAIRAAGDGSPACRGRRPTTACVNTQ